MTELCPTFFVSHGGGPCFWTEWNPPHLFDGLKTFFENLPSRLQKTPSAIVAISAHWEERAFTVQSTAKPGMIYDYSGFPKHTYELSYPAQGAPELASRISKLIEDAGLPHGLDSRRGYDHGVYVPLLISFPNADVPVLQVSLSQDLNPEKHFKLGEALSSLRRENIMILGSGFSYHNLMAIPDTKGVSQTFDKWLNHTLCELPSKQRFDQLMNWALAPEAKQAHPREEHLLPLLVCAGAAQEGACQRIYSENLPSWMVQTSCFQFN